MARVVAPGDENAGHDTPCPYNCPLSTADYFHDKFPWRGPPSPWMKMAARYPSPVTHFHDKCSWRWVIAAPVDENGFWIIFS